MELIGEIEINFLTQLFESEQSYESLLHQMEEENIALHKLIERQNKFKFIIPNPNFLYEKYKALEQAPTRN